MLRGFSEVWVESGTIRPIAQSTQATKPERPLAEGFRVHVRVMSRALMETRLGGRLGSP